MLNLDISNNPILNSITSMVQLMPTAMMVMIISVMMRDDHQVWVLLSPPFEAQIIQSLAGKKATFMRHSATVQRQKLLRRDDFYGVRNNTLLDQTFAVRSDQSFFLTKNGYHCTI